jgi:hypothetical protein
MRRRFRCLSPKHSKTTDRPRHPAAEHAAGGEQREVLGRYFAAFEAGTMVERDCAGGSTTVTVSSAPGRIRTCGLLLRRQALYPLSYGRFRAA